MRLSRDFRGLKRADDLSQVVPAFGVHQLVELVDQPLGDSRVVKIGRPDLDRRGAADEKVQYVVDRRNAADADDGNPNRPGNLPHGTQRKGLDARSAQTAEASPKIGRRWRQLIARP